MDATNDTLEQVKQAIALENNINKSTVSTGTGLNNYDLQRPSKDVVPIYTPLVKELPRVMGDGGTSTNWKVVNGYGSTGYNAMGYLAEGARGGQMTLNEQDNFALYHTVGDEASVTWQASNTARNFEDVRATTAVRLLRNVMLKQERQYIGSNVSVPLGTTPTPTLTASGTGATLPALTYSVICVAMTYEGWKNYTAGSNLTSGLSQSSTYAVNGKTFTVNNGYAIKSANATQVITLGQTLTATITGAALGTLAYAWYVGAAGSETLQAVTTSASTTFSKPLTAGTQTIAAFAVTNADFSTNTSAFATDGFLYSAFKAGSGSYVNNVGTTLTASTHGSVEEIDVMLETMYNTCRVSPSKLYVSSQEVKWINNKVLNGSSGAPLVRFQMDSNGEPILRAGQTIGSYFNPFQSGGGVTIPIELHPELPAGTLFGYSKELPPEFQSPNIPRVAEVRYLQDYHQIDFPFLTLEYVSGVYSQEVLVNYFPPSIGVLTGILPG